MTTQIPAPRVPLLNLRTGEIAREWYRFLLTGTQFGEALDGSFSNSIKTTRENFTSYEGIGHIVCAGSPTITLQTAAQRGSVLTITNAGTGVVTVRPQPGETIINEAFLTIDFRWSTMQLLPISGGYVII